ncbi:PspC domain-containing protein [Corynebacterium sp. J010B-136]|uniref:PspC domain-containing protein n=1 Tax=Corynebacterium sp. J010B-136 TaxID=2099401 RepID=UPI000CF87AAF|nr:PspC domain-containing protein [Corynebacterium sp. J010B-136]PQM74243.1 stress-responsive transcriptional regulator [Corynebacterium sp. J010B-136]
MKQKYYLLSDGKILGGVCSGIADRRGFDPNVIRFWFVLPMVFGVPMVAVYLWVWLTFPEKAEVN